MKTHLYNRDFASAFGRQEFLKAYALRWSASRALAYVEVFLGRQIREVFWDLKAPAGQVGKDGGGGCGDCDGDGRVRSTRSGKRRVVCIGGGAGAEVVALNAVVQLLGEDEELQLDVDIHAVDIADWGDVLEKLDGALEGSSTRRAEALRPASSKISSTSSIIPQGQSPITTAEQSLEPTASQSTTTTPTTPTTITQDTERNLPQGDSLPSLHLSPSLTFHHTNILTLSLPSLQSLLFPTAPQTLITISFTLNELFTTSLPLTTKFLLTLSDVSPSGTVLLVVDSSGSYSEVGIGGGSGSNSGDGNGNSSNDGGGGGGGGGIRKGGEQEGRKEKRRYPMQWLLDHTLLELTKGRDGEEAMWEKVMEDESRWFRLPTAATAGGGKKGALRYVVELENMRYQIHLFKRR